MDAQPISFNDYERFAGEYSRNLATGAIYSGYERPAILALAGEVAGRAVLDAGCGDGDNAAELIRRGATVTGLDASAALLRLARDRLGSTATLLQADLVEPLPLPDAAFDLVLSSLVLHYLADWEPTLGELRRVLVPGGRLVFSTHHPLLGPRLTGREDYLDTWTYTDEWEREGQTMHMRFWHRPLRDILGALRAAGFTVEQIDEPAPLPEVEQQDPGLYDHLTRQAQFIFVAATAG